MNAQRRQQFEEAVLFSLDMNPDEALRFLNAWLKDDHQMINENWPKFLIYDTNVISGEK